MGQISVKIPGHFSAEINNPADARNKNSELEEIFSAKIVTKDLLFDRSTETSPRVARRDDLIEDWLAQGDTSSQETQPEPTRHALRLDLGEQVVINPDLVSDYLEQLADARDRDRDLDRDDFDLSL